MQQRPWALSGHGHVYVQLTSFEQVFQLVAAQAVAGQHHVAPQGEAHEGRRLTGVTIVAW